jgi:hydroxymethylglutaryl-CoA lyase
VGVAPPEKIKEVVSAVLAEYGYLEIGVHLHSRPDQAAAKITAAYEAGCRRFDSAIGGLGGCPFAQDDLVGNIATETVIETLRSKGAQLAPLKPLDALVRATAEIGVRYQTSTADWGG